MRPKRKELAEIRDMVEQVAGRSEIISDEVDKQVFRMFGSLSQPMATGIAIGITFALHNLQEV